MQQQQIKHSLYKHKSSTWTKPCVRCDIVLNRTNHSKGSKSARITSTKATKKGSTVALCDNGAEDQKLAALIIFKEKSGKLGPHVSKDLTFPPNVQVTAASTSDRMT